MNNISMDNISMNSNWHISISIAVVITLLMLILYGSFENSNTTQSIVTQSKNIL